MATGTYVVEISWANNGTFTGTGENVTARTLHLEAFRGRDVNSQLTGKSAPGTMQVLLNNQSGDYNSFNSSSPLTGSLLPGRLIQLRATGPSTGTLWRGYIERIIPQPSVRGLDTVLIEAIGPLGFVNQKKVSLAVQTDAAPGSVVGSILTEAGWPNNTAHRDLDAGITVMRRSWFDRQPAMKAMQEVEASEGGFLREAGNGRIVFEGRTRRMTSPYRTSTATFSDAATSTLTYMGIQQEDPLPFIFTELQATIRPFTASSTGTLWRNKDTGTLVPTLANSSTLVLWAKYPNGTSPTDAVGVDSWVTPTATTDWNVFTDTAATGTNLNGDVALTVTPYGNEMRFLFNNTGTRLGFVTFVQARGVPLLAQEPVVVSQTSTGTAFGTRTFPSGATFIPDVDEANSWANWNLSVYEEPIINLQLTVHANRNNDHLSQAILREVSDRITVVATSSRSNLGFSRDFYIESIKHEIDSRRTHTVTYLLSDSISKSDAWVLNTSNLATNSKVHY